MELETVQKIDYADFAKVQILSGTIVRAEPFPEARKPAIKVWVDFGPHIGIKQSSAQITEHYSASSLVGLQVAGVVNLGPKRIGPFTSEFLLVGFEDDAGHVCLIRPDKKVPNGKKLF